MVINSPDEDEGPLDWSFGEAVTRSPLPARRGGRGGPGATSTLPGGVLIVLAVFLPWVTATDGEAVPGTNTIDGPLIMILGVILAGAGIGRLSTKLSAWQQVMPVVAAGFTGWAAWVDLGITKANAAAASTTYVSVFAGPGMYVVVFGAIIAAGGCLSVTWEYVPR